MLTPIAFGVVLGFLAIPPTSGTTIPTIPQHSLLTDVPIYTPSGERLPDLMDGIQPTNFPLSQFVNATERKECTAVSRLAGRVAALLPAGFFPSLTVLAQTCSNCFMTTDSYDCPWNCYGVYPLYYNTGLCAFCGNGTILGTCIFAAHEVKIS